MALTYPFSTYAIVVAATLIGPGGNKLDAVRRTDDIGPAIQLAQTQESAEPASASIRQMQEWLVWTGYYDGPLDGDAGSGTVSAIKRFQRDLGGPETGTLSLSQLSTLAERANNQIQSTGFTILSDPVTGIRVGIPIAMASEKRRVDGGTNFQSPDGRVQIGLRAFKTDQEFRRVYEQLKEAFKSTRLPYSVFRSDWLVLTGDSETRRFYLRYHGSKDIVAGFFVIYDKELSRDLTVPLSAAISMMSLTMQPFTTLLDANSISRFAGTGILTEPASLAQQPQPGRPEVTVPPAVPSQTATPGSPVPVVEPAPALPALQSRITELETAKTQAESIARQKLSEAEAARNAESKLGAQLRKTSEVLEAERNSKQLILGSLTIAAVGFALLSTYLGLKLRGQLRRAPIAATIGINQTMAMDQSGLDAKQPDAECAETVETALVQSPSLAIDTDASTAQRDKIYVADNSEAPLSPAAPDTVASQPVASTVAAQQVKMLIAIGGVVSVGFLVLLAVAAVSKIIGI